MSTMFFWNDNPGFLNLYGALKDALTVRTELYEMVERDRERGQAQSDSPTSPLNNCRCSWRKDPTAKVAHLGKPVQQNIPTLPPHVAKAPLPVHPLWESALPLVWPAADGWAQSPSACSEVWPNWLARRVDRWRSACRPGFSRKEMREVLDYRIMLSSPPGRASRLESDGGRTRSTADPARASSIPCRPSP